MSGEAPSKKDNTLVLAMVALNKAALPEIHEFQKLLVAYPDLAEADHFVLSEDAVPTITFDTKVGCGIVALMPAPIPWGDLEYPCEFSWQWPEAREALKLHTRHLIATISVSGDDKITAMLQLTSLVGAICTMPEVIGVYWGSQVHAPSVFLEQSRDMSREMLPLYLWIHFLGGKNSDGTASLTTTGMESLGFMEIEFLNSRREPGELTGRTFNVAHYLLDNGPVLNDGNTIGLSATEKIRIRHKPSIRNKSKLVYQLTD